MIGKYDLYDISAVFTQIRSNPEYEWNIAVLDNIIYVLSNDENTFTENQIREALASIEELDNDIWYYVHHNNVYVNHAILKNKAIYQLLIRICTELKTVVANRQFDRAYDLADAVHCLPEIIADHYFSIPKSYWKTHMYFYRKKWDKTFLHQEEKAVKAKASLV